MRGILILKGRSRLRCGPESFPFFLSHLATLYAPMSGLYSSSKALNSETRGGRVHSALLSLCYPRTFPPTRFPHVFFFTLSNHLLSMCSHQPHFSSMVSIQQPPTGAQAHSLLKSNNGVGDYKRTVSSLIEDVCTPTHNTN